MSTNIKLYIGILGDTASKEVARSKEPVIDNNQIYFPVIKDSKGLVTYTGKKKTYFSVDAFLSIGNIWEANLLNLDIINNQADTHYYYFYSSDGNTEISTTSDGQSVRPIHISQVIEALEEDVKNDDYPWFKWALELLKSMREEYCEHYVMIMS